MFKKIIFIIIILCSLEFYQLIFVPEVAIKVSEWMGISLIIALTFLFMFYNREPLMKQHFALPIFLILLSVVISMFGAYSFQEQSFLETAYGQKAIYFYFIYFLLHFIRLPGDFIIRTIITFALVYLGLYLLQYAIYPRLITSSKAFLDRGTLRIFLTGAGYLVITFFIWLFLTFRDFRLKYPLFLLVSLGVFLLLGTRQVIASVLLLTILFMLQSRVVKSRFFFFFMIALAIIPVYFLFQDVIFAMFDVTRSQTKNLEGNIRIDSARFFLTDFYKNKWAYFTGNGETGRSLYGLRILRVAEERGYYQSDIGLIGEYTKYGIIYVVGVVIILVRALRAKLPEGLMFIKYNFLGIILTLVTAAGAFGSFGANIVINCMLLYLIDLYLHDETAFGSFLTRVKENPAG
jgi:hypothetical protein